MDDVHQTLHFPVWRRSTMQIQLQEFAIPTLLSPARVQKSGSLLLFLYFSNMVNWISPKLLTVFLTTWLWSFLSIFGLPDGWGKWVVLSVQRGRKTNSKGSKALQLLKTWQCCILQLEVGPRRGNGLLVYDKMHTTIPWTISLRIS